MKNTYAGLKSPCASIKKSGLTKNQESEIVHMIMNEWDFCGTTMAAVNLWEDDNGIKLTPDQYDIVLMMAALEYRK